MLRQETVLICVCSVRTLKLVCGVGLKYDGRVVLLPDIKYSKS